MFLKEIKLDGFKCYESKVSLKNLNNTFNAITGLNGAGKSNIIDAIIFALCLDTPKLLRVSSYKELVNTRRKECSVTLSFNNQDKAKSPSGYQHFDELIVSRSIDSEGKTKLCINNHPCTTNTLSKILMSIGISNNPYFIVMQGHITKILSMKSAEIKNLVEETAGTRIYEVEKLKALGVLEKKEYKLKEINESLVRRISPFFDRLKSERENFKKSKRIEELKNIKKEIEEDLNLSEYFLKKEEVRLCRNRSEQEEEELRRIDEKLGDIIEDKVEGDMRIRIKLDEERWKLEQVTKEIRNIQIEENNENYDEQISILKAQEKILVEDVKMSEYMQNGIKTEASCLKERIEKAGRLRIALIQLKNGVKFGQEIGKSKDGASKECDSCCRLKVLHRKLDTYKLSVEGVKGTVEDLFELKDDKFKDAVFSVLGAKRKYIIAENDKVASELLKTSSTRVNVIPLNKIRCFNIGSDTLKKIRNYTGVNIIEVLDYEEDIRKGIEYVFNNVFLFEDPKMAKKACYDCKVCCVTLDGTIYDPRGTLSGGKVKYNSGPTKRDIEKEIRILEEHECINLQHSEHDASEKIIELEAQLQILNNSVSNPSKELDKLRMNIQELSKQQVYMKSKNEENKKLKEKLKFLKIKKEETEKNVLKLEHSFKKAEICNSKKSINEKEEAGLEMKKKYLMKSLVNIKSRIEKLEKEISVMESGIKESCVSKLESRKSLNQEEEGVLRNRLLEVNNELSSIKINHSSMDPKNFDLLERNEELIKNLEFKIKRLEEDKRIIQKSIEEFNKLGVVESRKALEHVNGKIGKFLRYFIEGADACIWRPDSKESGSGDAPWELRVKIGNWKDSLDELSGGQRSLVALALIFSMLTYRPAPFYIFDEIDAALDLSHTQGIGEIIKKEFNNSQFFVVSLKDGMYSNANALYQVYVEDGKSKIARKS